MSKRNVLLVSSVNGNEHINPGFSLFKVLIEEHVCKFEHQCAEYLICHVVFNL